MNSETSDPAQTASRFANDIPKDSETADPSTTLLNESELQPTYYVGIGASAGGLEAIEAFFSRMPEDSGMAFVVVQHLSPDYKSLMVELLSKRTPMPVQRAEDNMAVQPNQVYLIPPKKNLTIFHGKLLLNDQDPHKGINLPIDIFLRALAEDQSEKAVCIILSGTGSDGMRGVRAVKENGGMVMVQSEESAKFDGMPRAAISTGLADFVLPPEQMPAQLLAYAKSPYATRATRSSEVPFKDQDGLTRLFAILREQCKVDFTYYKPSTVTRRIERRMAVNQIDDIRDYASYMQQNSGEVTALYRELLIGVTSFFRDQAVFDQLAQQWLPELFQQATHQEVRFWVAGCSTGEEAYSLAILARECMEAINLRPEVKIFATDIDRTAIQYGAIGSYPESIAADLSPRLLNKYFFRKEDNYQVSRAIREMVVFAPHNLIKDPPFTNISLISCRNLLIYLQPVLQHKVLDFFNFSLKQQGLLVLGTSETTGEMGDYFEVLDPKLRIFRARGRARPAREILDLKGPTDTRFRDLKQRYSNMRRLQRGTDEERILERFLDQVGKDLLPLTLIVNEQGELLHVIGDVKHYFKLHSGKLTYDIVKMATRELAIPLTTGLQKVFHRQQDLRYANIRLQRDGVTETIELHIHLLPPQKGYEPLAAVMISPMKKSESPAFSQTAETYDLSKEAEERIRDLEQDLQFTQENLQATIEELETANEELQATNQELLASNEELQSTNQELQSTNEELFTVNTEYQNKIIELTELHNDVDNLLRATGIGTLLLDENLEVRRFSSSITAVFKLLKSDTSRPITHIPHHIVNCDPLAIIRQVQQAGAEIEREVLAEDGRWRLMRVAPYKIGPETFSGIIVSLVDIRGKNNQETPHD